MLLLTSDACNQWALAHRLTAIGDLVGIVFSENRIGGSVGVQERHRPLQYLAHVAFNWPFRKAWFQLLDSYRHQFQSAPNVPTWHVEEVNDPLTSQVIANLNPEVILVSGTNLLSRQLIVDANGLSRYGTLNLHTGLSPYIRGGPNCTNWCLATRRPWLIGNTVMWINEGIDSGDILATEVTPINGGETLLQLHRRVMDHAHYLTCRAITEVERGRATSKPQKSFSTSGDLYLTRDWSPKHMLRAYLYMRMRLRSDVLRQGFVDQQNELELVHLRESS
ncbi:MAG: formyltransferase family protein [Acidimicrobiales bacterium]|nr:formyltransferase family protein [Acidimicrobiales bacterium]|tara:strand:+ start:440 stop:1273 length:834 start_codon:yes stop_codon:yes gene_type:complete